MAENSTHKCTKCS